SAKRPSNNTSPGSCANSTETTAPSSLSWPPAGSTISERAASGPVVPSPEPDACVGWGLAHGWRHRIWLVHKQVWKDGHHATAQSERSPPTSPPSCGGGLTCWSRRMRSSAGLLRICRRRSLPINCAPPAREKKLAADGMPVLVPEGCLPLESGASGRAGTEAFSIALLPVAVQPDA